MLLIVSFSPAVRLFRSWHRLSSRRGSKTARVSARHQLARSSIRGSLSLVFFDGATRRSPAPPSASRGEWIIIRVMNKIKDSHRSRRTGRRVCAPRRCTRRGRSSPRCGPARVHSRQMSNRLSNRSSEIATRDFLFDTELIRRLPPCFSSSFSFFFSLIFFFLFFFAGPLLRAKVRRNDSPGSRAQKLRRTRENSGAHRSDRNSPGGSKGLFYVGYPRHSRNALPSPPPFPHPLPCPLFNLPIDS